MKSPIKLTVVMTHPVQYYAPWFRYIEERCPEIELSVLYATQPTPEQQGIGFDRPFVWDVSLTEGYRCRILRQALGENNSRHGEFWKMDVPEIGRAVCDSKPDVVLITGWQSPTLLRALWTCKRRGIPVLYRGDTNLANAHPGLRRFAWTARTWFLLRLFDGYLSVGIRAREYLRHFYVPESRIFDSPHCVDNAFFASSAALHQTPDGRRTARLSFGLNADDFVVLFVGKLEPKKRPLDLLRAAARLGAGTSALLVGSGELQQECRDLRVQLGVSAVSAGFLNQSELGRAYAAADCLVLPSAAETWGLVVNEALATGLPCVVSDRVGCGADLVASGETGEIFPVGDVGALANALERIRDGNHERRDRAAVCRAKAAQYSFHSAATGLVAACRAFRTAQRERRIKMKPAYSRILACCGGMVIYGGLERMTFEALRVLRERGASVHCIVNSWENQAIVAEVERMGATWSTGYYRFRFERYARNPIKLAKMGWDAVMTSLGLLRDAWRFRPTHILLPDFVGVLRNSLALTVLRAANVNIVLYVHNAPARESFYGFVWRWGVNPFVDRFICCSRFVQGELQGHGIPVNKTLVIANIAPARSQPDVGRIVRDRRKVIYVGQIIPQKGLHLLLEAIALLRERGRDVRLDIVGRLDGWVAPGYAGYRERLLARARNADLAGAVNFLGWREDVPALLAGAGVHCCPSGPDMLEGMPLVNIEAKWAGTPSVVFPLGPFPELVRHQQDGWICAEISASALAQGIDYFLADEQRLERATVAARMSALGFSRECFTEKWVQLVTPEQGAQCGIAGPGAAFNEERN